MVVDRGRELSSWKEIAAHLGVGVRTAQEWEHNRGLPVRRLPGPRGRVLTTVAELDHWKRNGLTSEEPQFAPVVLARRSSFFSRRWRIAVGALASLVLLGAFSWFRPGPPAGYRVDGNAIVILDSRGREVWRKTYPSLFKDAYEQHDLVWIGDLDGDGSTEVLIGVSSSRQEDESPLLCYERDGRERWRFSPTRVVATQEETFTPEYRLTNFRVAPFGNQTGLRVLVVSHHYLYYPCQVALLAPNGNVLREYWHSGHLNHALVVDGGKSVLLAGIDNGLGNATLLSLDPDTMSGASVEQNKKYQLQGFTPGVEQARLLFPRACFNRRLEPHARIFSLWWSAGEITVNVNHRLPHQASVYYHLLPDLTLKQMEVGTDFRVTHAELAATHVLDHQLSVKEVDDLRKIKYLKGPLTPTPNNY